MNKITHNKKNTSGGRRGWNSISGLRATKKRGNNIFNFIDRKQIEFPLLLNSHLSCASTDPSNRFSTGCIV